MLADTETPSDRQNRCGKICCRYRLFFYLQRRDISSRYYIPHQCRSVIARQKLFSGPPRNRRFAIEFSGSAPGAVSASSRSMPQHSNGQSIKTVLPDDGIPLPQVSFERENKLSTNVLSHSRRGLRDARACQYSLTSKGSNLNGKTSDCRFNASP